MTTTAITQQWQVMAELRGLKADISELGRSLDGSTISFITRQRDGPRNKTGTYASNVQLFATLRWHTHTFFRERRN